MRIFFIFFWLILGLSLVITGCRGAKEEPPDSMSPQQITITATRSTTDSIAVTWALKAGSTGEAVVGVVAVLQEAALTPANACENVPADVAAHARDGSGETSGRSGGTTYMASNSDSGTLTFGSLAASTMYSIAVCSVSAMKIRGDGTGGTAHSAVVTSVTTDALFTFPKQVTVPMPTFTPGSPPTITVTWSVDTASLGADVQGVVAVLKPQTSATEASLNQTNACENVPMAISDHARGSDSPNPSMPMTDDGVAYIADNRDGASQVMFSFPFNLTEDTTYSLAVCSVAAGSIRGDGNSDADDAHAVVYSGISATPQIPVKQIEVTTTTTTASSITLNWAVISSADDTHQDVQGVVTILTTQAGATVPLDPTDECRASFCLRDVISYARDGMTGSSSATYFSRTCTAGHDSDNNGMGSLTLTGLRASTTYAIVICAVSANNIRGDNNPTLPDDDAILVSPSPSTAAAAP